LQKAALYVNRGLGTFGFPVRIGVPPEITLLTLREPEKPTVSPSSRLERDIILSKSVI
jgi:hypothetical protein